MSEIQLTELARDIVKIAELAGDAIMDIYNNEADFGVESKSDDSPLTKADSAANTVICDGLENLSTVFPIISEENREIPYEERSKFEYCWLVDPLDGTKEFIKRNGEFTVNIALIKNKRIILGVVYAPVTKDMFWAAKDCGAWLLKDGEETRITANQINMEDEALRLVCSRSHLNDSTQTFVDQFKNPELVAKGSSLKFLIIANGHADIYPRLAPTMEWDTGAAQIILEEAGGSVINNETKQPLVYNKENLLNPHFIAFANLN